jgi:hypothetical protein
VIGAILLDWAEVCCVQQLLIPDLTNGATDSVSLHYVESESCLIWARCDLSLSPTARTLECESFLLHLSRGPCDWWPFDIGEEDEHQAVLVVIVLNPAEANITALGIVFRGDDDKKGKP